MNNKWINCHATNLPDRQILILFEPPRIDRRPRIHERANEREHDRYCLKKFPNIQNTSINNNQP